MVIPMTPHDMLSSIEKSRRERIEFKAWQLWQNDGRREGWEWHYRCEATRLVEEEERRSADRVLGQQPRPVGMQVFPKQR